MRLLFTALACLISLSVLGQCLDSLACNYYNNNVDFGDGLIIPDDQTQCFYSELTFTNFDPEAEVTNALTDILNLFINFEHSYMGDLTVTFICPNGQSMAVHQQGGQGTILGIPDFSDGTGPGTGWDYYWSPTATNGTWAENAGETLPAGAYESEQPFSNLNGCPLNGTWEIEVCDIWGGDDGYIFDWTIQFNSSLYDNSSCIYIGDSCDDNNPLTSPDFIDENCFCGGIEITRIDELESLSVIIYPNPTSNILTVDLGDLNGVNTTIKLYDSSSKLIFDKQSTSTLTIDVSGLARGMYSLELSTDEQVLRSQVIIE